MADDRQPPAYDAVVGGTWQQGNTVTQNIPPYPPYPAPSTNAGFGNDSLPASQQTLPPNLNTRLSTKVLPSYSATVGSVETKVDVSTPATTTNSDDETSYVCFSILLFCVAAALPIAMIVMGVSNLENCADDASIPVYSIVAGSLAVGCFLFFCTMFCFKEDSFGYNVSLGLAVITMVGHFGVQCWGSYIVFSKWQRWRYNLFTCDESTYLLSFSTLIIYWILWLCCGKAAKSSD